MFAYCSVHGCTCTVHVLAVRYVYTVEVRDRLQLDGGTVLSRFAHSSVEVLSRFAYSSVEVLSRFAYSSVEVLSRFGTGTVRFVNFLSPTV